MAQSGASHRCGCSLSSNRTGESLKTFRHPLDKDACGVGVRAVRSQAPENKETRLYFMAAH